MTIFLILLAVIIVTAVALVGYIISTQRQLVHLDELCRNALGQIEVQLNSRWDAIMALAQTAARYSSYEAQTLIQVIEQRRMQNVQTAADVAQQQQDLQNVMGRLIAVGEAYPALRSADLYSKAMEGVNTYEEHVRMARMVYNDTATKMNRTVRQFPTSLVAGMLGFGQRDYLTTDAPQKAIYPNLNEAFRS